MTRIIRGAVQRTTNAYDDMITGTMQASFPGQPIFQQQQAILEVLVQNDPDSANNVKVGNEFGQFVVLQAGVHIVIPINNLNKVWVESVGGATVHYIAMV